MYLILTKNGVTVDHPPILAGNSFYYSEGQCGSSSAKAEWSIDVVEVDEDGQPTGEINTFTLEESPPTETPPEPTPEQIRARMPKLSPVQFRKMLRGQDITAAMVEAAIALIPDDEDRAHAHDAWEYSTYYERSNPLIDLIGTALGLTPEQIDAAWTSALV